jgi:hypothetical protein
MCEGVWGRMEAKLASESSKAPRLLQVAPPPAPSAVSATMQVGPGADGIQKLLAAETEAQRIVSEARKGGRGCCRG